MRFDHLFYLLLNSLAAMPGFLGSPEGRRAKARQGLILRCPGPELAWSRSLRHVEMTALDIKGYVEYFSRASALSRLGTALVVWVSVSIVYLSDFVVMPSRA